MKRSSVADGILRALSQRGIGHVFLVPGAQIDPLFASLGNSGQPRAIIANHELGAGYMADGYARAGGTPGVALSIGGPGAANLVGAAATARSDDSPVLFITGNIPTTSRERGEFQDGGPLGSNDAAVFQAAIGASFACQDAGRWRESLAAAERVLATGMPAHLSLPLDVQAADAGPAAESPRPCPASAGALPRDLLARGRPLLLIGAGALDSLDSGLLGRIAGEYRVPVATDLSARGILAETRREAIGHIGFMPHPRALAALGNATAESADRIVTVGIGPARLGQHVPGHFAVTETTPSAFAAWALSGPGRPDAATLDDRDTWMTRLAGIARPPAEAHHEDGVVPLAALIDAANECLPTETLVAVDAGQVRRVAAARMVRREPRSLFIAEGMSPMGWGLCAAIGASLARPDRPVVALVGDGAMRMHGIEIATAARYRLPVVFVVCDNRAYGSIAARVGSESGIALARLPAVDWCGFAGAFGVRAQRIGHADELRGIFARMAGLDAPLLLSVPVPLVDAEAYRESSGISWVPAAAQKA